MAAKYSLFISCILLSLISINGFETVNGKIKITVGTTAGCRFTVMFIQDQLVGTYEKYKEHLELEFIPWGRTRRNDDGTWWCQFNNQNCWANRLQRCALSKIPEQEAQLRYMACEFSEPSPSWNEGSYRCAYEAGLNLVEIDYCVANPEDELDRAAEAKGTPIIEEIDGVPSIVLNDIVDRARHSVAYNNLENTICTTLAADSTTGVSGC